MPLTLTFKVAPDGLTFTAETTVGSLTAIADGTRVGLPTPSDPIYLFVPSGTPPPPLGSAVRVTVAVLPD